MLTQRIATVIYRYDMIARIKAAWWAFWNPREVQAWRYRDYTELSDLSLETSERDLPLLKEIWYVTRKNIRENKKAYPWTVYDLQTHTEVAFVGSEEKAKDWARQLNENGYVQAE